MSLPGFNAEASLHRSGRTYRGTYQYGNQASGQSGVPALVLPSQFEALEELETEDEMGMMDAEDYEVYDEEDEEIEEDYDAYGGEEI